MKSKSTRNISARRVSEQEQVDKIEETRQLKKITPLLTRLDSFVGKLYREFSGKFEQIESITLSSYDSLFPLPGEVTAGGTDQQYLKELTEHMKYLRSFKKKYARFIAASEKQLSRYKELDAQLDRLIAEAEQQKG